MNSAKIAWVNSAVASAALAFLGLFVPVSGASAQGSTDFYVSTGGSDSTGNGSATNPWATIQHASTLIGPGATVHVAPGSYAGNILTQASGTSSAPITYISDTPYAAKIVNSSYSGSLNQCVWDNEGNYVTIQGFDLSGAAYQGIGNGGSYVVIKGNHVHDVIPADCNGNGGAGIDDHGTNSDDVGNVVNDVGNFALGPCNYVHGIYGDRTGGHIWNNIIYHIWSFGIQLWGSPSGLTISGNTVFNNGDSGLVVGADTGTADHMVVTNNIFVYNNGYGFEEQGTTGTNNQYNNNLSYGNGQGYYTLQTGSAVGTIEADPQFVHYQADGGNVQLTGSSPAINAGTSQGSPRFDFAGNTRPQTRSSGNGWDIGAYEFVGVDFLLASTPSKATIAAGQAATYTLSISPEGGFSQSVSLACSEAPPASTCSVSPASLTLDGATTATATVTVNTTAPSGVRPLPTAWPLAPNLDGPPSLGLLLGLLVLLGAVAALSVRRNVSAVVVAPLYERREAPVTGRRYNTARPFAPAFILAATLLLTLVWASCGGASGNLTHRNSGTPAGTYSLTVTASSTSGSGTLQHTVTLTLTVK